MLSSIEISQKAKKKPIEKIAARLGIQKEYLIPYGKYIAKIDLDILKRIRPRRKGKYILVTAITPTPLGEGKTVTTIGLSMALNKLGKRASVCIRESSLGPVFGVKGGGAGGGYSQVLPMEEFNLHFTGDVHAVGFAHNLAAAFLDNSIFQGNPLRINTEKMFWRRVIETNDRSLRSVNVKLGSKENEFSYQTGFDITAASEVMACVALSEDLNDLRHRLSKIVLAEDTDGNPVTAENLKVSGSMSVLLKDAIKPNLIQTIENTPCFVHTVPFANIAHGNSSIIADRIALFYSDYVVTEAGFGADCGAEKFFDIKCRVSGLIPDAVVLVCSIRALKVHSARFKISPGKPLPEDLLKENLSALEEGFCNLKKQIENIKIFGVPVVVAVNRFDCDTDKEIELVKKAAISFGADDCQVSQVWLRGSKGGIDLAGAVIKAASKPNNFRFLYPLNIPIKEKIKIIATSIYGAKDIEYTQDAENKIIAYNRRKWDNLAVCMAKTHLSLSDDPKMVCPRDFNLRINDIRASIGAGFLYALCGQIQTMPGLPKHPAGERIDIDEYGITKGLF